MDYQPAPDLECSPGNPNPYCQGLHDGTGDCLIPDSCATNWRCDGSHNGFPSACQPCPNTQCVAHTVAGCTVCEHLYCTSEHIDGPEGGMCVWHHAQWCDGTGDCLERKECLRTFHDVFTVSTDLQQGVTTLTVAADLIGLDEIDDFLVLLSDVRSRIEADLRAEAEWE